MNIIDIITKKRDGGVLYKDEVEFAVNENLPDYQISALLMAIFLKGMSEEETISLTHALANSGKQFDFTNDSSFIDLHSTGGVGDKCTLIVAPIAAACGCKVAKLAGRGLGHTGGTVDKLESFKGFTCNLSPEQFENQANSIGIAICEQTKDITPKDGEWYHLRDVTGTVESIPLIASSIMSKKLATGCPNIVLDITYGNGAFMKTKNDAKKLAKLMTKIGTMSGRKTLSVITPMNEPLGNCVGNTIEVEEAISYLKGELPEIHLQKTCTLLLVQMLRMALGLNTFEAYNKIEEVIKNGAALEKFKELIKAQGGEWTEEFTKAPLKEVKVLDNLDAYKIGEMVRLIGGGRLTKNDKIDLTVGIRILDREKKEVEIYESNK